MDFRRGRKREEPEINFIPLIDLMLVILIFVMATTTYSKFQELKITLPSAEANKAEVKATELEVAIGAAGQYMVGGRRINFTGAQNLAVELRNAANGKEPVIVINADADASHQSVVNVMEAARLAGFAKLTFATQAPR